MATVKEFIEIAARIIVESGFELVDVEGPHRLTAIRDKNSSVLTTIEARTLEDGEPVVLIRAVAVTDFARPDAAETLKLLSHLSHLNSKLCFGTWYYAPDWPAVILDHSLLVNHMEADEFAKVVLAIEKAADRADDELSDFLSGETAKQKLIRINEEQRWDTR